MDLKELGWSNKQELYLRKHELGSLQIARVVAVHKERYVVRTIESDIHAEITGNLRFSASSSSDLPAVGDWVAIMVFDDNLAIIHQVLPRTNILERQAVTKEAAKQVIAANVDYSFIIQSVDQDFNLNRLERYLTISMASDIEPIALLSKTDLIPTEELEEMVEAIEKIHPELLILPFSNNTRVGYEAIIGILLKSKTYCFLGSSGVGKSTLINHLFGEELMKTHSISTSTGKGKHTTSHRELFILNNGSIVIDTPGMREIGIVESVERSFDFISELARKCRFSDCTHTQESGCAILEATENNLIDQASYDNYMKMQREAAHFQSTLAEKRKKDKKFGKIIKQVLEYKKKNKF